MLEYTLDFDTNTTGTGRVLCISVFNGQSHSQILNYVTAPNVCIFSAVVASAAIPKLLPPVVAGRTPATPHSLRKPKIVVQIS